MTQKIIIDTDPGKDDAIALLLALASPELDVIGISTVAGNVGLELTSANARKICELARRSDIPVHAGADAPLKRALMTAEHVHGQSGLAGPPLPEPQMPLSKDHCVDFMLKALRAEPAGSVTICALGPLTNIAMAITQDADTMARAKRIVLMGGGWFDAGNVKPAAEFNIMVDPEAADIVFRSGIDIVVVPLDATHQMLSGPAQIDAFRTIGPVIGEHVAAWAAHAPPMEAKDRYGPEQSVPLHDPCVIAWLLAPDLFSGRQVNVSIETEGKLTTGMTVVDWWDITDRPANALFLNQLDAPALFAMITERLARLEP